MSDPFLAEIRMFTGNFAPTGWAKCDGQLMPISQNTALFALLGNAYGGDAKSTFALPNLQGRAPMHTGTGPGLSERRLGEAAGAESVTLTSDQLPQHTHQEMASASAATATSMAGAVLAGVQEDAYAPRGNGSITPMAANALAAAGESQPHDNMQPYLTLMFIIALQGIFPQRP